jgi:hypothetical protein
VALVLLSGGGGHLDLDDKGCPRALTGNLLVRLLPHFRGAGFATALVDAPSDFQGEDGLGGYRIAPEHAQDLRKVIADVRLRTRASIWLVGSSRGSISAVNAAARLTAPAAPDGLVLASPITSGFSGGRKAWVAQTVFDLPLDAIRIPVLVVGHAEDKCVRTPPRLLPDITARTSSARERVVTVTGGPGWPGAPSVQARAGRMPHGFVEQRPEVAAGSKAAITEPAGRTATLRQISRARRRSRATVDAAVGFGTLGRARRAPRVATAGGTAPRHAGAGKEKAPGRAEG